jgi:hypothetical protein
MRPVGRILEWHECFWGLPVGQAPRLIWAAAFAVEARQPLQISDTFGAPASRDARRFHRATSEACWGQLRPDPELRARGASAKALCGGDCRTGAEPPAPRSVRHAEDFVSSNTTLLLRIAFRRASFTQASVSLVNSLYFFRGLPGLSD